MNIKCQGKTLLYMYAGLWGVKCVFYELWAIKGETLKTECWDLTYWAINGPLWLYEIGSLSEVITTNAYKKGHGGGC